MRHEPVAEHAPWTRYLVTWLGLLALTLITFGLSFLRTGAWEIPIAMLFATAKTVLVLLIFMHLIEQRFVSSFVIVVSVSLMALLLAIVVADVATRRTFPAAPLPEIAPPPPRPPPPPGGP